MSLAIDYKLTGSGWAECTISDGVAACTVTASYLSDALADLILSASALLHWFNGVSFSFQEEPGEFRWTFQLTTANDFELKLWQPSPAWSDAPSRLLFRTTCTPEIFGNAVHRAASKVQSEYGETGYLAEWVRYPFPTQILNELTRLLAAEPSVHQP